MFFLQQPYIFWQCPKEEHMYIILQQTYIFLQLPYIIHQNPYIFSCGIRYPNFIFQQPYIFSCIIRMRFCKKERPSIHYVIQVWGPERLPHPHPVLCYIWTSPYISLNYHAALYFLCSIRLLSCSTCIFFLAAFFRA